MATLKEIIYNVKNLKAGGQQNDDIKLSDRQYAFIIDYYRAKLLRQKNDRNEPISPNSIQNLGTIPVILADIAVLGDLHGVEIYKTRVLDSSRVEKELPKPVEFLKGSAYTYVGPLRTGKAFQRTQLHKAYWDRHSQFTADITKWFDMDRQIYCMSPEQLRDINVQGIFESPLEVRRFLNLVDEFDPFNFEYPLSSAMLDSLYKMMMDAEVKFSMILPQDQINDGQDTKVEGQ